MAGRAEHAREVFERAITHGNDLGYWLERSILTWRASGQLPPSLQPHRFGQCSLGDCRGRATGIGIVIAICLVTSRH